MGSERVWWEFRMEDGETYYRGPSELAARQFRKMQRLKGAIIKVTRRPAGHAAAKELRAMARSIEAYGPAMPGVFAAMLREHADRLERGEEGR
jgi:hypothetical protein